MKVYQLFAFVLLLGGIASATWCFQDTADGAACGDAGTGDYSIGGWTACSDAPNLAYDEDWNTATENFTANQECWLIINYTIPPKTTSAKWQAKWYNEENGTVMQNYTLNTTTCNISATSYNLMIQFYPNETEGYADLACQQSAGNWYPLLEMGNPSNITDPKLYEEGMWWDITPPPVVANISAPANTTYAYVNRTQDVTFSCTGNASLYDFDVNDSFDNSTIAWGAVINDTPSTATAVVFDPGAHSLTLTCWNDTDSNSTSVSFYVSSPISLNYTVDYLLWAPYTDYSVAGGQITVGDFGIYELTYLANTIPNDAVTSTILLLIPALIGIVALALISGAVML